MKKNSNLFIAVGIIMVFIIFWDHFVLSRFGSGRNKMPTIQNETPVHSTATSELLPNKIQSSPSKNLTSTQKPTGIQPTSTSLETDSTQLQMESWGARVSSWKIKEKDTWIELVYSKDGLKRLPLETFPNLNFSREAVAADRVTFAISNELGYRMSKSIILARDSSLSHIVLQFSNPSTTAVDVNTSVGWGVGLAKLYSNKEGGTDQSQAEAAVPEMKAIAFANKLRQWKAGFIFGRTVNQTNAGPFEWAGVANNHFMAVFIPVNGSLATIRVAADSKTPPSIDIPLAFKLGPGEVKDVSFDLYVGPKKLDVLKALGHHLDSAVDFGTFGIISKWLLYALEFFKRSTGNYGWAIILLTICLQMVLFPLTKKSLDHSVKMRELQPQLKELQKQFKTDPKRLQIETLNLYKKQGMHFMGLEGCFPVLLQIPVFFAFYAALNGAYELRGAPWIFWIKDLAAPDPYYVLPILMGGGMFLQSKLTTVATDPAQAKMMLIMPIVFVFMFLKMPAGLVLYWTVNSICTILIQRVLLIKQSPAANVPT